MKKLMFILMSFFLVVSVFAGEGKVRVATDMDNIMIYVNDAKKASGGKEYTSILLEEGEYEIKVVKKFDDRWSSEKMQKVFVGEDTSQKLTIKISEFVKDKNTGLIWTRCSVGYKYQDNSCVKDSKSIDLDFGGVLEMIGNLRKERFANYNDWRLPSFNELNSLIHCPNGRNTIQTLEGSGQCKGEKSVNLVINTKVFPSMAKHHSLWSSTSVQGNQKYAWTVSVANGYINDFSKRNETRALAVRGSL